MDNYYYSLSLALLTIQKIRSIIKLDTSISALSTSKSSSVLHTDSFLYYPCASTGFLFWGGENGVRPKSARADRLSAARKKEIRYCPDSCGMAGGTHGTLNTRTSCRTNQVKITTIMTKSYVDIAVGADDRNFIRLTAWPKKQK